jgi:hypothetical protein
MLGQGFPIENGLSHHSILSNGQDVTLKTQMLKNNCTVHIFCDDLAGTVTLSSNVAVWLFSLARPLLTHSVK